MAVVKKISELTPKGSALSNTDLLVVGVDNGTDYDLKSVTGAQILGNVISQTITDGDTTHSPSSNVVYDSLALKVDKVTGSRLITSSESTLLGNTSGTNTGDETANTIKSKLGITTLSGSNTGDQDLQSVTDIDNTTSNNISIEDDLWRTLLSPNSIQISPLDLSTYSVLDADGKLQLKSNATAAGAIKASNLTANVTLEIPNKTVGTYTIATTTDLTVKVDSNTAITGDTKTKITYDSKGLVTTGTDATTADIADSLNKRYVTDANLTTIGNTSGTNTGDQIISDATITTTDITTNNFSTTKHGFVPKGTNVGNYLKDDGTWSTISAGGLTFFTEAQSTASPNATVNVDSLKAIASTTNADISIVPKGTGAFTLAIPNSLASGGNKRGANAIDLQTYRTNAINVASGIAAFASGADNNANGITSVALGNSNTASGTGSVSIGYGNSSSNDASFSAGINNNSNGFRSTTLGAFNNSSSDYAVSIGASNTASGGYSVALGRSNTASGSNSTVMGYYASTFGIVGRLVNGYFNSVIGDAQKSTFILSKRTTDATPSILAVDNLTVTATNQLTLQNNNSIRFKGSIIARQSGSTNTSAWDIDGIIQRGTSAGTTTLLISNVNVVQNTPAWGTPTLTANTTLGCLTVTVTGASTTNIQWTCSIDTTEVIYA
jgi:hypothetical protein